MLAYSVEPVFSLLVLTGYLAATKEGCRKEGGVKMKTMFTVALALILLFSFALSAYITFYKFPLQDPKAKVLTFLMLGAVATVFTFIVCLTIVWPPVM